MTLFDPGYLFKWIDDGWAPGGITVARKDDEPAFDVYSAFSQLRGGPCNCNICGVPLNFWSSGGQPWGEYPPAQTIHNVDYKFHCNLCGWYFGHHQQAEYQNDSFNFKLLKRFNINSNDLSLAELGSHFKNHSSDMYYLDPYRFEELINNIFHNHGYDTVHTSRTRDGGADILIYHNESKNLNAIVECKRSSEGKKVGVQVLRNLVGAAVDWNVNKAYLVTTGTFTSVLRDKALDYKQRGYEIDLREFSDITKLFDIYNENLPPVQKLTTSDRQEILKLNTFQNK